MKPSHEKQEDLRLMRGLFCLVRHHRKPTQGELLTADRWGIPISDPVSSNGALRRLVLAPRSEVLDPWSGVFDPRSEVSDPGSQWLDAGSG